MNTEIKSRINTIGTVGRILTIIAIIVVIASIVCAALAMVVTVVFPKDAVTVSFSGDARVHIDSKLYSGRFPVVGLDGLLENGRATFKLAGAEFDTVSVEESADGVNVHAAADGINLDIHGLFRGCIVALVYLAAVLVMLYFLKALMTEFKTCDTPFAESVIKKMTNFGWSLIPMAVLSGVTGSSITALVFSGGAKNFDYSLNLSVVLVVLVVLALVQVFKYGAQLQQQSDETL